MAASHCVQPASAQAVQAVQHAAAEAPGPWSNKVARLGVHAVGIITAWTAREAGMQAWSASARSIEAVQVLPSRVGRHKQGLEPPLPWSDPARKAGHVNRRGAHAACMAAMCPSPVQLVLEVSAHSAHLLARLRAKEATAQHMRRSDGCRAAAVQPREQVAVHSLDFTGSTDAFQHASQHSLYLRSCAACFNSGMPFATDLQASCNQIGLKFYLHVLLILALAHRRHRRAAHTRAQAFGRAGH